MSDPLGEKTFAFVLRIVTLGEFLQQEKHEFTISRKIIDSSVNIGLFIEEARQGDDRAEFGQKYSLANKEAFKTHYLLRVIHGREWITTKHFTSLSTDCDEIKKMLVSALKTTRGRE